MTRIVKRRIKRAEAELLISKIRLTPNIVGYTFKEWLTCEHIIIAEDDLGQLLGACLNYDFAEKWTKIAALYVLEEFRHQGIGKSLFYESYKDARKRQKNVYTISCNSIVINMMHELELITFNSLFDFPATFKQYRLDFYTHSLQWLSSSYRIKEIIRKQIAFPYQQDFIYGLKSYS